MTDDVINLCSHGMNWSDDFPIGFSFFPFVPPVDFLFLSAHRSALPALRAAALHHITSHGIAPVADLIGRVPDTAHHRPLSRDAQPRKFDAELG